MTRHWTEQNVNAFRYRITSDFLMQLEKKMDSESPKISRRELARRLDLSAGRISQILNGSMDNFSLDSVIRYARVLGMKISLVAYEDDDSDNTRGPIDSEIFNICWEREGKPIDFFDLNERQKQMENNLGHFVSTSTYGGAINKAGKVLPFILRKSLGTSTETTQVGVTNSDMKIAAGG